MGAFVSKPLSDLETTLQDYAANLNPIWENVGYFPPKKGEEVGKDWTPADFKQFWNDFAKAEKELDELKFDLVKKHYPNLVKLHPAPKKFISRVDSETSLRELLSLTEDQVSSYNQLLEKPRCVINGAAGTGKTVLAKEFAEKRCKQGKTVGLMCSNLYLSHDFEKWAAEVSDNSEGSIIVGTPATLPGKIFEENSTVCYNPVTGENTSFGDRHNQRCDNFSELETTLRYGYLNYGWNSFIEETIEDLQQIIIHTDSDPNKRGILDYLIVDEAQNLCDRVFLELMDILLKQGLVNGSWSMFGDFVYQDIVTFERGDTDVLDVLQTFCNGRVWEDETLRINCRNTQEISVAVDKFVPVETLPKSGVHGPYVQIEFFDSLKKLNEMLLEFIPTPQSKSEYPKLKECILLSSDSDNIFEEIFAEREDGNKYNRWELRPLPLPGDPEDNPSESPILRYSDVYDYQGLESNLVILVMPKPKNKNQVELPEGGTIITREAHLTRVFYTGMSRAHTKLVILAEESYSEFFKTGWPDYGWEAEKK